MNRILVFGLMSFCLLHPLAAQEYSKVEGVWNAAFIDLLLNDKLSLRSEFSQLTVVGNPASTSFNVGTGVYLLSILGYIAKMYAEKRTPQE